MYDDGQFSDYIIQKLLIIQNCQNVDISKDLKSTMMATSQCTYFMMFNNVCIGFIMFVPPANRRCLIVLKIGDVFYDAKSTSIYSRFNE